MEMRVWHVLLLITTVAMLGLLLTPQRNDGGHLCNDVTAAILLSPGYTDGDIQGAAAKTDSCGSAARRKGLLAAGVALGGGIAAYLSRSLGRTNSGPKDP